MNKDSVRGESTWTCSSFPYLLLPGGGRLPHLHAQLREIESIHAVELL